MIDLHVQIDARRAESAKEKERKERLEYRLQKLRASVDFMKVEIQARTTHLSAGVGEIGNLKSKSRQQNPPSDHAIIRVLGDELTRQVPHKSTSHGTYIIALSFSSRLVFVTCYKYCASLASWPVGFSMPPSVPPPLPVVASLYLRRHSRGFVQTVRVGGESTTGA